MSACCRTAQEGMEVGAMIPTVRIHRYAFETMVWTSIEMFKKECCGMLFGKLPAQLQKDFIVAAASSNQRLKKMHGRIEGHTRSERRLRNFFATMPAGSRPIGRFHAHTEWGRTRYRGIMSLSDIISTAHEAMSIECIIEIHTRKRGVRRWHAHANGSIHGSFRDERDNYNFVIHAYTLQYRDGKMPKPMRLKIIAPEAIRALNRALGYSS